MSKKDRRQNNQEIIETTAVDETEKVDAATATDDASDDEPKVAGAPVKVEKPESFVKKVGRGIAHGAKTVWNRKLSIGEIILGVGGTIAIITGIKAIYNKGRKDAGDELEDFDDISDEEYEALAGEEPEREEPEETVEEVVDDSEEETEEYDDDTSEEETEYDEDVIEEEDE